MKKSSELIESISNKSKSGTAEDKAKRKAELKAVRTIAAAVGLFEAGEYVPPELRREIDEAASELVMMRAEDVLRIVLLLGRSGVSLARPISPVELRQRPEVEELPAHRRVLGGRF